MKTNKYIILFAMAMALAMLTFTFFACNDYNVKSTELTSITAIFTQETMIYESTPLNTLKSNLVVKAQYNDESEKTLAANAYNLLGTLTEGISKITVSYTESDITKTNEIKVIVIQEPSRNAFVPMVLQLDTPTVPVSSNALETKCYVFVPNETGIYVCEKSNDYSIMVFYSVHGIYDYSIFTLPILHYADIDYESSEILLKEGTEYAFVVYGEAQNISIMLSYKDATIITDNISFNNLLLNRTQYYKYTPKFSGEHEIKTDNSSIYISVFNSEPKLLESGNLNFSKIVILNLSKGKEYYISIVNYNVLSAASGTLSIKSS